MQATPITAQQAAAQALDTYAKYCTARHGARWGSPLDRRHAASALRGMVNLHQGKTTALAQEMISCHFATRATACKLAAALGGAA